MDRSTGTGRLSFFSHTPPTKKYHSHSNSQSSIHRPLSAGGSGSYQQYAPPPGQWPSSNSSVPIASHPPPPQYPPQRALFSCNICAADLTYRPRIHCHHCPDYDVCSTCYLTRRTPPAPHEGWHEQQTCVAAKLVARAPPTPGSNFNCDNCGIDVTNGPRARCLECVNFDLCADCHIIKAVGLPSIGHLPNHKMNVITDWQPETTQKLVNEEYYPSNLYLDMIDAIFNFIHKHYNPPLGAGIGEAGVAGGSSSSLSSGSRSDSRSDSPIGGYSSSRSAPGGSGPSGAGAGLLAQADAAIPREQRVEFEVLEATKLARFYRAMGMLDKDNSYLAPTSTLSRIYSRLGLEYIIIPSPSLRKKLADRVFPWQIDYVETAPEEPALTRAGFRRSFVLGTFLNPEGTFFILQNLLSTGMLVHPMSGVPFKSWVPRQTLPTAALGDLVEWERTLHASY